MTYFIGSLATIQVHSGGPLRRRPLVTVAPSPLRWPAPAENAHHGRSKSTPVARSDGDRSPRSTQVHSGGPLRRRPLATVVSSPLRWTAPAETARHGRQEPGLGRGACSLSDPRSVCSCLAWFRTLSLHLHRPVESTLVPKPGNRCTGLRGPGHPLSP